MAWCKWQHIPKAVQIAHVFGEIIPVLSGNNIAEQPIWCAGQNFQLKKWVLKGLQLITVVRHPREAARLRQHSILIWNSDFATLRSLLSKSTLFCFSLWGEWDRCTIWSVSHLAFHPMLNHILRFTAVLILLILALDLQWVWDWAAPGMCLWPLRNVWWAQQQVTCPWPFLWQQETRPCSGFYQQDVPQVLLWCFCAKERFPGKAQHR